MTRGRVESDGEFGGSSIFASCGHDPLLHNRLGFHFLLFFTEAVFAQTFHACSLKLKWKMFYAYTSNRFRSSLGIKSM